MTVSENDVFPMIRYLFQKCLKRWTFFDTYKLVLAVGDNPTIGQNSGPLIGGVPFFLFPAIFGPLFPVLIYLWPNILFSQLFLT